MVSSEEKVIINTIYFVSRIFMSMISVSGNLLPVISIPKYHFLHTSTNIIIFNLALSDVFMSFFVTLLSFLVEYSPNKEEKPENIAGGYMSTSTTDHNITFPTGMNGEVQFFLLVLFSFLVKA